ncbi:MAG: polyprenyl synthetase family protein [Actinomycetota bacterium]|nr:polyprenyl synthetase family protein [Actinomycetota bacterium]
MAAPAVPASLSRIAGVVESHLEALLDAEVDRWGRLDADLMEPLVAMRDLVLAGGKRVRPAFCQWGFAAAGGDPWAPAVVDAGAALELLHTFALIHDDVMDGSDLRRGADTVHRAFQARHAAGGWRGEGRRFGEGVAILVGDLAFVYADRFLADAPPAAWEVFTELRLELNMGQYLDLLGTARGHAHVDQARRTVQYKSGKYTIERPLHLGAALAGRLHELESLLSAYGSPLGEAFQLRDDLLGAFGDTAVTGKPVGDDLRAGRPTTLYAFAAQNADPAAARLLSDRFGAADLSESEVTELQRILEESGARQQVEDAIDRLLAKALTALGAAPIGDEVRERLAELARFVVARDR